MTVLPVHNALFASGALIVNEASSPSDVVALLAVRMLLPSIEKAVNSPPSGVVQLYESVVSIVDSPKGS